jgi:hypothetical protein
MGAARFSTLRHHFFKYIKTVCVAALCWVLLSGLFASSLPAQDWLEDYQFDQEAGLPYYGSTGISCKGYGYYHRFGCHGCRGPKVPYTYQTPDYYVKYSEDYDHDVRVMGLELDDYKDYRARSRSGYRSRPLNDMHPKVRYSYSRDPLPPVVYAPAPVRGYPAPGVLQRDEPPVVYNHGPVGVYNELPRHVYTRDDHSETFFLPR